jgi:hypothetical protein
MLGLLVLGQYACSHAGGPINVPSGTRLVLLVDADGNVHGFTPDGKPLEECAPCPKQQVNEKDHTCKIDRVEKLPVCRFLTNVTVTDVLPLAILHSQGSCFWGYSFRNGYFSYGYICQ